MASSTTGRARRSASKSGPSGRVTRHLFLGFIRLHILHHAGNEPVSGVDLAAELGRHGYALSPGTLYPILHGLRAAGYLRCTAEVQCGHHRKCYSLTAKGRAALEQAKKQIQELMEEVMEHRSG
jgi:PadR family transcriptional regulator, regulatory protein PadR